MTESQLKGMIRFHRKAERAYRKAGNIKNSRRAHEKRAELLFQLKNLRNAKVA